MDLTKEAIKFMTEMETKPHERIVEMEDGRLFAVNTSGNVEEVFSTCHRFRYTYQYQYIERVS